MYVFHCTQGENFPRCYSEAFIHCYSFLQVHTTVCVEVGGQTDLGPAFHIVLHWLASDLPGNPSASNSHLTVRTLADRHNHLWFYYSGAGYLNSGPQAPPTGPSPQSLHSHSKDQMSRTLKKVAGELWVDNNVIVTCHYMGHLYSFDVLEVLFNNYIFNYSQLILEINS